MKNYGKDGLIGLFGVVASVGSSWISNAETWISFGSHVFGFVAAGLSVALLVVRLRKAIKEKK